MADYGDEESLLLSAGDFLIDVMNRFYPVDNEPLGDPLHWRKLPWRVIPGETSLHSGFNGHGKSLWLGQWVLDQRVIERASCIASFEMPAYKSLYRMVRQALGKVRPEKDEIILCMNWLSEKVFFYDKVGIGNLTKLDNIFRAAIDQKGCTFFVIDSLMKCGIGPKDIDKQKAFMDHWQNFAQFYGVNMNIVAHAKKLESEEEKPGKMDVAGASELTNMPDNVYSIWRNKPKEDKYRECLESNKCHGAEFERLVSKYDAIIDCSKNRELGGDGEGKFGLYFHKPSMQFVEQVNSEPFIYFSK